MGPELAPGTSEGRIKAESPWPLHQVGRTAALALFFKGGLCVTWDLRLVAEGKSGPRAGAPQEPCRGRQSETPTNWLTSLGLE